MAWYSTLSIGFGLLILMTFSGLPLFAGFLLLNLVGVFMFFGTAAFGMYQNSMVATLTSAPLIAVPLFLLMGEYLFRSSAIDELYNALDMLIGKIRIRLYAIAVSLATILGTMSGSAMADAAILARTLFPGMVARGYDRKLSAGIIMSGATLAPIIPPSILAIVLATLAEVSIAELLIAGLLPGLLMACMLIGYVYVRVLLDPSKAPETTDDFATRTFADRGMAIARILPFGGVIFMVIGLIMLGIASPTEAAACGVFATILVSLYLRTFNWKMIWEGLFSAIRTTATIFVILMSANLFGQLLSFTGAPEGMVGVVEHLELSPGVIFFLLMLISFIACMFLGQTEYMLISVPIFVHVIKAAQFNEIWFWMLYLVTITIGGMTPPFGMTMFVFKASSDMTMTEVFNSTYPYVVVLMAAVFIMYMFPPIVTFLPSLIRY
ncbi:MAG: TRAP transporter large permease [Hyphomicrobiales bacterium]|nr:TRAP transporter large permease [Hyphomicrobiales bacterium]